MGNYQKNNPYSNTYNPGYAKHPNLSYSITNTLNHLLPNPPRQQPQQQQQRPPSAWEETMAKFMQMTQSSLEEMKASQEAERKNNEAARKMFETQIGQIAKQMAEHTKGGFSGNTQDNLKNNESCNVIELRSKKVLTPPAPKVTKKNEEDEVEENEQEVVEKNGGVVENEQKEKK